MIDNYFKQLEETSKRIEGQEDKGPIKIEKQNSKATDHDSNSEEVNPVQIIVN